MLCIVYSRNTKDVLINGYSHMLPCFYYLNYASYIARCMHKQKLLAFVIVNNPCM